jgi:hypothetical protein
MTGPRKEQQANGQWGDPACFTVDLPGGRWPHIIRWWVGVDPERGVYRLVDFPEHDDAVIGAEVLHQRPDGVWCGGYVAWPNVYGVEETGHQLVSVDPATIVPSLACKSCESHGFVIDGHWVDAG